jgi:iron complex transport system substrate-binding protein
MKHVLSLVVLFILSSAALIMPVSAQDEPIACVQNYDPAADYFADEVTVDYAVGFDVEYFNNYKVVHVTTPWQGAETPFTYVLVRCGTPVPDGYDDATVIEVPVQTAVSMSTTYIPHFVELGLLDSLVGVDEFDFIYSPEVRERIDAGEIVEIGGDATVNVEQTLDLDPDVIFTYGLGTPDYDAHPVLLNAGLNVVLNGDYMETTPLGRAEWVKFTSLFFNAEAAANALFEDIATTYSDLSELAASVEERPSVMVNGMYGDTWYVAGGNSFMAALIADAGGDYLWAEDESTGGLPLSFEAVLDRALAAEVWLNPNFWLSLDDGLAEDERYAEFAPFQKGQVFNNVAQVTPTGGNNFGEAGVLHPEELLADLITIFHPDLLPDHALIYYVQLQ